MGTKTLELGRRVISAACAVVLAAGLLPAQALGRVAPAQVVPLDEPTVQVDYVIEDQHTFKRFRDDVNAGKTDAGTTAVLEADISMTFGSSNLPVGTVDVDAGGNGGYSVPEAANAFVGMFDGQGHTVTVSVGSMYSSGAKTQPPAALFGVVGEGGVVRNLIVDGYVDSSGNSSSSAVNGAAAGAVGILLGGTVENVANYAEIAGANNSSDTCNSAGGIVGFGWGSVRNCANHGSVTKQNGWSAGIVGRCASGKTTTIENCYNTGAVSAPGAGEAGTSEVAAVLAGGVTNLTVPVASGCYYLAGTADAGLGAIAAARKGAEALAAKTARELKHLYATLGADWQHGGTANAPFGGYPALIWEEAYGDLKTFTVTFDANGGAEVAPVSVAEGFPVAAPTTPVRSGYVFQGWFADGARASFPFTPEADVTFTAQWTPSTSALAAAINAATAEVDKQGRAYRMSQSDDIEAAKAEVVKRKKFATPAQLAAFEEAIDVAKALRDDAQTLGTARTAEDVAAGIAQLDQATSVFTALYSAQVGEKVVSLSDGGAEVAVVVPAQVYSGSALKPEPVVTCGGDVLAYRVDYTLKWSSNTEPGAANVIVSGMDAYSGSVTQVFEIAPAPMSGVDVVTVADAPYVADGARPSVSATFAGGKVALVEGVDYELTCSGNDAIGQATATLVGKGVRFTGSKTVAFNVVKGENPVAATAKKVTVTYSASALQTVRASKVFSVTGAAGDVKFAKVSGDARIGVNPDGAVRVQAGTPAGTYKVSASVIAAGDALYNRGTVAASFDVVVAPTSVSGAAVTLSATSFTFNGKVQKPTVKSMKLGGKALAKGDYTVSYSNASSKAVGSSYKVAVKGKGNYTDSKAVAYKILKAPTIKAKTTSKKVTAAAAKKAAQSFKMGTTTSSGGKLTYSVVKANKNITVSGGTVKLKAGAAKGTHKATVRVTSAAKGAFGAAHKDFTVSFTVK